MITAGRLKKEDEESVTSEVNVEDEEHVNPRNNYSESFLEDGHGIVFGTQEQKLIYDGLLLKYLNGEIKSLSEVCRLVKDQLGLEISAPTLSRRLRHINRNAESNDEQERKRKMGVLKGFTIMQRALSSRYNASLLTVMDDKTKEIRQYAYMKSSVDGRKEYYRCNRCLRAKRKSGSGKGAQASIIVYDGEIIGDKPPEHHADCEPVSYEEIASITSQRESRAFEREENEQVRQVLRNRQLLLKQTESLEPPQLSPIEGDELAEFDDESNGTGFVEPQRQVVEDKKKRMERILSAVLLLLDELDGENLLTVIEEAQYRVAELPRRSLLR
uniref:RYYR-CCHC domain-containing protein n=1 Tax=Onchocerca volvulus TaxID=6282 RepID=A0A2K6WFX7_ONCVO